MNMLRKLFILVFTLSVYNSTSYAQISLPPSRVEWNTLEEALQKNVEKSRPLFVFVYSNNNDSSRIMLETTFANEGMAGYISRNFYPIAFNVEEYRQKMQTTPPEQFMALAKEILDRNLTPPAVVYIDRAGTGTPVFGYKTMKQLEPYLVFFAEEINTTTPFEEFYKYYVKVYPPDDTTGVSMTRAIVKWRTLEEAFEEIETSPKKIFIDIYADWRIGNTIMFMSTYNNPIIGNYLNEHFIPVRLDAVGNDTIKVKGVEYVNLGEEQGHPFHQLPIAMLEGKMFLPAMLILNEEGQVIQKMQSYFSPETIESILKYYGEDFYKTQSWDDFLKTFQSSFQ